MKRKWSKRAALTPLVKFIRHNISKHRRTRVISQSERQRLALSAALRDRSMCDTRGSRYRRCSAATAASPRYAGFFAGLRNLSELADSRAHTCARAHRVCFGCTSRLVLSRSRAIFLAASHLRHRRHCSRNPFDDTQFSSPLLPFFPLRRIF